MKVDQKFNRAEVGFWLGEQFWNMGLMTEALKSILKFGFKVLELHKIDAHHLVNNIGSGRTMEKNGMIIQEGRVVYLYKKGPRSSTNNYRPETILNIIYKTWATAKSFQPRQVIQETISKYQTGFRYDMGCADALGLVENITRTIKARKLTIGL